MQYAFEYTAKDGRHISIKPNESYVLVSRTNEHWWHVRKDQNSKPFYIPAQYVKKHSPKDPPGPEKLDAPECEAAPAPAAAGMAVPAQRGSREINYVSTAGSQGDSLAVEPCNTLQGNQSSSSVTPTLDYNKNHTSAEALSLRNDSLYGKVQPVSESRKKRSKSFLQQDKAELTQMFSQGEDMDFPPPPDLSMYDTIPELNIPESELPDPGPSAVPRRRNQTAEKSCTTGAASTEEVSFVIHVVLCWADSCRDKW